MCAACISRKVSRDKTGTISRFQELAKVVLNVSVLYLQQSTRSEPLRDVSDDADLVLPSIPDGAVTALKY
jgi:hypothetical protein